MKFKVKPTVLAVAAFIALTFWAFSSEAVEVEPVIGLSTGIVGPFEGQTQILGVILDDRWGINYERFPEANSVSAWRRVYFRQSKRVRPLLELGATYFDEKVENSMKDDGRPVVNDNLTYHLAVGVQIQTGPNAKVEIREIHNSTAGRRDPNTGIDRIAMSYTWSF